MHPHGIPYAKYPKRPFPLAGGKVGFPIVFGVFSYRIRILMYRDVSCMYPVGYMYLECILMA